MTADAPTQQFDILIVGGGMIGSALALGLSRQGWQVGLIEGAPVESLMAAAEPATSVDDFEARVSAISLASQRLLEQLGAWKNVQAGRHCGYREMTVWDADGTGRIHFDTAELHARSLGTIVENRNIVRALFDALADSPVQLLDGVRVKAWSREQGVELEDGRHLAAALVVGADGALSRLLAQQTNFSFEIVIHDDASTDRTVEIIQEYAKKDSRIVSILQTENQYSQNIKIWPNYLFPKAQGKYIALCEGDDYWTDPLKLQKQVDFLEVNPDYVISWTNYQIFNGKSYSSNNFNHQEANTTIDYDNLFSPYCTLTLTTVFKKEALNLELLKSLKHSKDNSLYILVLQNGKGVFMDFESAVYRVHEAGVYSLQSNFFKNYSSYINLKEVTDVAPESKSRNMNKVLKSLEEATATEVLKLKYTGEKLSEVQVDFIATYLKSADFKTKIKYYKKLFKYKFLK